jgi:hypothetical protein
MNGNAATLATTTSADANRARLAGLSVRLHHLGNIDEVRVAVGFKLHL